MNRRRKLTIAVLVLAAVLVFFIWLPLVHSARDYQAMSMTAQLEHKIKVEHGVYSSSLFESVEVIRPWYSRDPSGWIFVVTMAQNGETLYYRYDDGEFVLLS